MRILLPRVSMCLLMAAPFAVIAGHCEGKSEGKYTKDYEKKSTAKYKNVVEVTKSAGLFSSLLAAGEAAGLVDTLTTEGPITVFAPTDEAFVKVPEAEL